jgi:hypothetical protein
MKAVDRVDVSMALIGTVLTVDSLVKAIKKPSPSRNWKAGIVDFPSI